ncbi:DNA-binding protein [Paludibacter sp. 221]|uniref:helix-turn-helix domain-containing protein n=1 Tax=Paludibacter sp. 221 TaxID=2302939 RepID=UPI0013CFA350|nr:helix-turn-helix domain-containing protein [Paludibacter sp. 221]NDV47967.1 DNA-binding protein [Paludibacter sp. 221]
MTLITKRDEQITEFFTSLDEMQACLEDAQAETKPSLNGERYFTDQEVSERLKISRRTLQDYRNQGIISYIQLGGKIIYRESDLQKLLEQNYFPAWRDIEK